MKIAFYGATDMGRVRTNNEDTFIAQSIWDDNHILLVAIDGMGGEEGGEIAAEIARRTIIDFLTNVRDDNPLNLIKTAVAEANNEIVRHKEVQPRYQRMGCVATAGIFDMEALTLSIAHVGDSRLYRFSNGELKKLTHDHSLVGYQEEQGILTEEQAMRHPRRSVIERCLGAEMHTVDDKGFIEAGIFPLTDGESFIFCSDGLSDVLTSAQIAACMRNNTSPQAQCNALIAAANEAGGKDNITVVIAYTGKNEPAVQQKPAAIQQEHQQAVINRDEDIYNEVEVSRPSSRKWIWLIILCSIISAALGFFAARYIYCVPLAPAPTPIVPVVVPTDTAAITGDSVVPNDTITQIPINKPDTTVTI